MTATGRQGVHVRAVGVFLLVSFGAALLLDGVVAATGGLGTPQAKGILTLRMFVPALAAWVVCRFVTRESWLRASGLARRSPGSGGRLGWLRILGFATTGVGIVVAALALLLTLVIGAGGFSPDWALTSFTNNLRGIAPGGPPPPVAVIWVLMVVANVFAAYTVNGLVALGEETGWRGWLQSALEPLGRRRGIVLTGVIWGLWHAPLIVMATSTAAGSPRRPASPCSPACAQDSERCCPGFGFAPAASCRPPSPTVRSTPSPPCPRYWWRPATAWTRSWWA